MNNAAFQKLMNDGIDQFYGHRLQFNEQSNVPALTMFDAYDQWVERRAYPAARMSYFFSYLAETERPLRLINGLPMFVYVELKEVN